MLPTGFRTFHFVSFLYVFFLFFSFSFVSFLFSLFCFRFFAFRFFRFFSLLFSLFSFRFFSFRFFLFLFVFFPFLSLQVPLIFIKTDRFFRDHRLRYTCNVLSWFYNCCLCVKCPPEWTGCQSRRVGMSCLIIYFFVIQLTYHDVGGAYFAVG